LSTAFGNKLRFDQKRRPAMKNAVSNGASLLKKLNLRCQLRDGKGYHLRTSKLNPLPPLLTWHLRLFEQAGCMFAAMPRTEPVNAKKWRRPLF